MYFLNKQKIINILYNNYTKESQDNFWNNFLELARNKKVYIKNNNIYLKYPTIDSKIYQIDDEYDDDEEYNEDKLTYISTYKLIDPIINIYKYYPNFNAKLINCVWAHCDGMSICFGDGYNYEIFSDHMDQGNLIAVYYLLETLLSVSIPEHGYRFSDMYYGETNLSSDVSRCAICQRSVLIKNSKKFKNNLCCCNNCFANIRKINISKIYPSNLQLCYNCGTINLKLFKNKITCLNKDCKYEY